MFKKRIILGFIVSTLLCLGFANAYDADDLDVVLNGGFTHFLKLNLSGADFSGKNLSGMCFEDVDFSGAILVNSVFNDSKFINCNFDRARFTNSNIRGAIAQMFIC